MSQEVRQVEAGTLPTVAAEERGAARPHADKDVAAGPEILTNVVAKPCPFCGHQPVIEYWHGGGPRKRLVSCSGPSCLVQPAVCGTTRNRAIENWNYRPGSAA